MQVKLIFGNGISRHRKKLKNAQKSVDKSCMKCMGEFVPTAPQRFKTSGKLRDSLRNPRPGKLIYADQKARYIYYDTLKRKNRGNLHGTRIWFETMKTKYKNQILNDAQKEIKK